MGDFIYFIENFCTNQLSSLKSSFYYNILVLFGIYYLGSRLFRALCWFKKYFLTCEPNYKQKYGDNWVVLTGGTDGIGKCLAKEFLIRGHKLLIIAKNETKAVEVIKELKQINQNAQIEYIIYDLDRSYNDEDISELERKLSPYKQVSILVNNAGIGGMKPFESFSNQEIRSIINVNLKSITFFTKVIIPKMKENKKSLIVFSGSGLHLMKPFGSSIYSSSKCYLDGFMSCLTQEYENIDFSYLEIGPVFTNLNRRKMINTITPEECASSLIKHLGVYEYTSGNYKHGFYTGLLKVNKFFLNSARKLIKEAIVKLNSQKASKN